MCLERGDGEADEAHEVDYARRLDRPEAEAVAREMVTDATGDHVTLGASQDLGKELHHLRIGVQRREGREVLLPPLAQAQARGRQDRAARVSDGAHGRSVRPYASRATAGEMVPSARSRRTSARSRSRGSP